MAKRITEYPQISSVTDTLSVPCDNGIQTFRQTSLQYLAYLYAKLAGLSAVDPLAADSLLGIDASDSNNPKRFTIPLVRNYSSYRAVVNPDNSTGEALTQNDDTIKISGTTGKILLPANSPSNPGKRYKLIHLGTSLTNVYTILTTGGATVGGIASGSYALYTNREVLEIEDDGTDWIIINHWAQTDWADAGAITFGATTTAPTKPTGLVIDKIYWRRDGRDMLCRFEYRQSNTTSANSGTGDYTILIPGSQVIDTTTITAYATAEGTGGWVTSNHVGDVAVGNASTNGHGVISVLDTTKVRMLVIAMDTGSQSPYAVGSGGFGLASSANNFFVGSFRVPISGWRV